MHCINKSFKAFFLSFIDLFEKLKRVLSKAKKLIKQTKNNLFHAYSGNGRLVSNFAL